MTENKRIRQAAVLMVPQNLDEAANFLFLMAEEERTIIKTLADINRQIEELKAQAVKETKPNEKKINRLIHGLFIFAESHRQELTKNNQRKSVPLVSGSFGWHTTSPAIKIKNTKAVLAELKRLELKRFIRTKEEIDRRAMLKEPELAKTIKGVSIVQHENFLVKLAKLEIEIALSVEKLKKAAA